MLGNFLKDVVKLNAPQRNFRIFGPDETLSNGLEAVFDTTRRQWEGSTLPADELLAPSGRVVEMLSEHQCEGWLEGYLLTGRHGLFNCYEAFIHIIDSMFNQHAKWLKVSAGLPWRRRIASLNYLLAFHVWRQDHNGFTHQDPGFIDQVVNKKAEVVRVYLPPDANCLLSVMDHCLRSRHYVNVVVAGKHPAPQWLEMDAAVAALQPRGIGIWPWASNDQEARPDVVMACCGDVPTLETLAAVSIFREHLPDLKIRFVNVVDLMRLQPRAEHPHGLSDTRFDDLFTKDKPVIFAFHAYPWLIHPADLLPAPQPREHACPRVQGRGHHDDPVRHDRAQRPRPLPSGHGRHRPPAADRRQGRLSEAAARRQADRAQAVHQSARGGSPRGPKLVVESAGERRARLTKERLLVVRAPLCHRGPVRCNGLGGALRQRSNPTWDRDHRPRPSTPNANPTIDPGERDRDP